jgi:hypothetical protein
VVSFVGGSAEKPFGGPLDAENVAAHRHGVQVEFEHLRLVVDAFQLAGNDHLLQLVDGRGEEPVVAARKRFLASCWLMVLPPPELSRCSSKVFTTTRARLRGSTPLCW